MPVSNFSEYARRVAAAARRADADPTEAQREALNFRVGKVHFHGLEISITNPKGSIRRGKSSGGKEWERVMAHHYGHICRTESEDGEQFDVFIGEYPESQLAFTFDFLTSDYEHDETKAVIGVRNLNEAKTVIRKNYPDGWLDDRIGEIRGYFMADFKKWLRKSGMWKKKAAFITVGGTVSYDYHCLPCDHSFDGGDGECPLCGKDRSDTTTNPKLLKGAKERPHTVAVDLDGTILTPSTPPDFGRLRPKAKAVIQGFKDKGYRVIIFTVRNDNDAVGRKLVELGVPYDYINENPDQPKDGSGKVIADVYIDDRAVSADKSWTRIEEEVESRREKSSAYGDKDPRFGCTCPNCGSTDTHGARAHEKFADGTWDLANAACGGCGNGFSYDYDTGKPRKRTTGSRGTNGEKIEKSSEMISEEEVREAGKKDRTLDRVQEAADLMSGIQVWYNPGPPAKCFIDVMDWGSPKAGELIGKELARVVGKENVEFGNENNPEGEGWVKASLDVPNEGQHLMATRNSISVESRGKLVALLNQQLADLFDLMTQAKFAHWNVKGANFISLHKLFDDLATTLDGHVDTVAERLTALGGTAMGTARMAAAASTVPEFPHSTINGNAVVSVLADRCASVGKSVRDGIDKSDELGDRDTADVLTAVSRDLDKNLYFLESHLQG